MIINREFSRTMALTISFDNNNYYSFFQHRHYLA